jgi:hypothetical protein
MSKIWKNFCLEKKAATRCDALTQHMVPSGKSTSRETALLMRQLS